MLGNDQRQPATNQTIGMAALPNEINMAYPLKRIQQPHPQQQQHPQQQPDLNNPVTGTGCGGLRLDMNRNTLSLDRQVYDNFKFCQQDNTMKSYMRNNMRSNHVNSYMPYPTMPFSGLYYRQMGALDFGGGGVQNFMQTPHTNQRNTAAWPFDQMNDFCTEMLNRDKHYWTEEETTLMLELYEENRNYFNDTKTKKTKVWSIIANIINKRFNTNVNSEQCSQKYRNLKAEFLKVVDPNSSENGAKKFGRHFLQMKRLIEFEERKGSKVVHVSPQNATPAVQIKQTNTSHNLNTGDENIFDNKLFDDAASSVNELTNQTLKAAFFPSPQDNNNRQQSKVTEHKDNDTPPNTFESPEIPEESYSAELNNIFQEYFEARSDSSIHDKKEINTECLKGCLVVFKKMIEDGRFL